MREELKNTLFERYPKLFSRTKRETRDNLMYFGFSHGDGWYKLVDKLCGTIQFYVDNTRDAKQPYVFQVKEKMGGLRFYLEYPTEDFSYSDPHVNGLISLAETLSRCICEDCGSMDHVGHTMGYIKTICAECLKTFKHDRAKDWVENLS